MLVVNYMYLNRNGQNAVTIMLSASSSTAKYNIKFRFSVCADFRGVHDFHSEFRSHLWFDQRWIVSICLLCVLALNWDSIGLLSVKKIDHRSYRPWTVPSAYSLLIIH